MGQAEGTSEGRLSRKDRRRLKEEQKEAEQRRRWRGRLVRKGLAWGVAGLLATAAAGWLGYSIATAKRLVYLATYPEMDVRIAVTKLGKILTLDEPDLEKIRAFITE